MIELYQITFRDGVAILIENDDIRDICCLATLCFNLVTINKNFYPTYPLQWQSIF